MKKINKSGDYIEYEIVQQQSQSENGTPNSLQSIIGGILVILGIIGAIVILSAAIIAWGLEGILMGIVIIVLGLGLLGAVFKK